MIIYMKKGPEFRMVGGASPEKKEKAKQELEKAFFDHIESLPKEVQEKIEKLEYPKSEKEIALIDFANQETSRLMEEVGVEPHDIPLDNYHIIPPELYEKEFGRRSSAVAHGRRQAIAFNAENFRDNPILLGMAAIHETLHLKAQMSFEIEESKDGKNTTPYREGVTVRSSQLKAAQGNYHEHFRGLHEAIVSEAEKRLLVKLLDQRELAEEKKWLMSDEAGDLIKKLSDEIIWVGKRGSGDWKMVGYRPQREVLDYICGEIHKQFPEQFGDADGVFKEFLKAHFTGRLLPIARLIDKTFGDGSFRIVGNMDDNNASGVSHLETLKKSRARVLK